jgi:hypothetical protein
MDREFKVSNIPYSRNTKEYAHLYYEKYKKEKWGILGVGKAREHNPNWKGGKPKCIDCGQETSSCYSKRCRPCADKYYIGEKNHQWRGGRANLNSSIRYLKKYNQWRTDIFIKDNWTCQFCNKRGGKIEVHHHPKSFKEILITNNIDSIEKAINCLELWNPYNGITLCVKCHNSTKKGIKTYG